jgi:transcriptional regulator with XRE-family HTH domain
MPREAWTDTAGGLRACREALAIILPQLTAPALAEVLGLNPDWYRRIETGRQGVSIKTFATLAQAYLGLLDAFGTLLSPVRPASLHTLLPEAPAPTPFPALPAHSCSAAYCWRIHDLRIELGRQRNMDRPFPARQIALALRAGLDASEPAEQSPRQFNDDRIAQIQTGQSAGSIPTLIGLYQFFSRNLSRPRARPLLLDDILVVPHRIPHKLIKLVEQRAAGGRR